MTRHRHALVLGKMLPPHRGHLEVVRFARALADRVTVLVESRPDEPFSAAQRARWVHEALARDPSIEVRALEGDHPQAPPSDPAAADAFWRHWAQLLRREAGVFDAVAAGDAYGARLAADQGAAWLPFDRHARRIAGEPSISATTIKAAPWDRWDWLIEPARQALLRRFVLVGAESTGKSVLAHQLAVSAPERTVVVPEYAEGWMRSHPGHALDAETLAVFLDGQAAARAALRPQANRWLVEDSHALTTAVWAAHLGHGELAERALALAQKDRPHRVLLATSPGTPWVPDAHRPGPTDRRAFDAAFRARLDEWGWSYAEVEGDWSRRTQEALAERDRFLDAWRRASWSDWCAPGALAPRSTPKFR